MNTYLARRNEKVKLSPIREIFEMASRTPGLVRLEVGQPDFATPDHIIEGAKEALNEGHIGYSSAAGIPEARHAIAKRLKKDYDLEINPESEIVVSNGASAAVYLTLRAIINPGEEVLRPDPGWAQYDGVINDADGIPVLYPLVPEKGFAIDFEALDKLVTPKTKAIIINTPSNPTGGILGKEQLEQLLEFVKDKNILIISDEAYDKIIYEKKHISIGALPGSKDKVITIGSCSKNYAMCGWRVGFAAGPKEIMNEVMKYQSLTNICPNYIAQKAAVAAFNGTHEATTKMKDEYQRRRDFFVDGLNKIPGFKCIKPEGAFYAFVDITAYGMDDWAFTKYMIEKVGVTCIPGSSFGPTGKGFIRFSYASSIDNIKEGLKRMEEGLSDLERKI